jgi:hypothetical protein
MKSGGKVGKIFGLTKPVNFLPYALGYKVVSHFFFLGKA